jgi:hypothetical protein
MTVAENDVLTPTHVAIDAYTKAKEPKQLNILKGAGHFDGCEHRPFLQINSLRRVAEFSAWRFSHQTLGNGSSRTLKLRLTFSRRLLTVSRRFVGADISRD